eukprot:5300095-Lingulodinium_polyedra.AAC.1
MDPPRWRGRVRPSTPGGEERGPPPRARRPWTTLPSAAACGIHDGGRPWAPPRTRDPPLEAG